MTINKVKGRKWPRRILKDIILKGSSTERVDVALGLLGRKDLGAIYACQRLLFWGRGWILVEEDLEDSFHDDFNLSNLE